MRWFWGMDGSAPGPGETAHAQPAPAGRHAGPRRPECRVRRRRQRGPDRGARGDDRRRRRALPARRRAGSPDADDHRDLAGRLDGQRRELHPVRRADEAARLRQGAASRAGACFRDKHEPTRATVKVGPVAVNENDQPSIGRVTAHEAPATTRRLPGARRYCARAGQAVAGRGDRRRHVRPERARLRINGDRRELGASFDLRVRPARGRTSARVAQRGRACARSGPFPWRARGCDG